MGKCEYTEEIDKSLSKCIYCGKPAKIIHYDWDIWYAECSNPECNKHPKYSYIGLKRKVAVENWEYANRPINRKPSKKGK